jgi:hypothetical protein
VGGWAAVEDWLCRHGIAGGVIGGQPRVDRHLGVTRPRVNWLAVLPCSDSEGD